MSSASSSAANASSAANPQMQASSSAPRKLTDGEINEKKVSRDQKICKTVTKERQLHGVVGVHKGTRTVYIDVPGIDADGTRCVRTRGPFENTNAGERDVRAVYKEFKHLQHGITKDNNLWVNRILNTRNDDVWFMLLDAPFTESVDFPNLGVYIDKKDIPLVIEKIWGACLVDGEWYAFNYALNPNGDTHDAFNPNGDTDDERDEPQFLHHFLLSRKTKQLASIVDGDTLNMTRNDLISVYSHNRAAPEYVIQNVKEIHFQAGTSTSVINATY